MTAACAAGIALVAPLGPAALAAPGGVVCITYLTGRHCDVFTRGNPTKIGTAVGMKVTPSRQAVAPGGTVSISAGRFKPDEYVKSYVFNVHRPGAEDLGGMWVPANGIATAIYQPDRAGDPSWGPMALCLRSESTGKIACGLFTLEGSSGTGAPAPAASPASGGAGSAGSSGSGGLTVDNTWKPPSVS